MKLERKDLRWIIPILVGTFFMVVHMGGYSDDLQDRLLNFALGFLLGIGIELFRGKVYSK